MAELDKVINRLNNEITHNEYWDEEYADCVPVSLLKDALELLKAQDEVITALLKVGYPHDFQRKEPWIVNYMSAITDVVRKAVHLRNGRH